MTATMLLCSIVASAYDFKMNGLCYNIISEEESTVEVTYSSPDVDNYNYLEQVINIPQNITYQNNTIVKTYRVTSIGYMAFFDCENITSIIIPEGVTLIDASAFYNCTNLANITFPNSLIETGLHGALPSEESTAFYNTKWLANKPNGFVYAGKVLYKYKGNIPQNTSIEVEEGTLGIGAWAFANRESLTNITIPNSVKIIGARAFYCCKHLTNATIKDGVTTIRWGAFESCTDLTSITIPNGVTSIEERAIAGCTSLTSITIPESVTSIGSSAFSGCTNLTTVYMQSKTPPTINVKNDKVFDNYAYHKPYSTITMYVPKGSLAAYQAVGNWKNYYNIVEFDPTSIEDVTEDVPTFEVTADGIQFTTAKGKVVAVYTTSGALVEKIDTYAGEEITLDKGVYIIRVGDKAVKIKL